MKPSNAQNRRAEPLRTVLRPRIECRLTAQRDLRVSFSSPMTQSRTTSRQLDERLAKALSHPLRQRILQRLNEGGVKSPNELSRDLGDPLGNVSYHVRILRELDCVELVRTEQRRGALEHYYRATAQPWLDDKQWARLPAAFRRKTLGRTLSELLEAAGDASQTGGFDDAAAVVNHVPLVLDEQGWKD